jgi:YidC/Oxa1 family membrane protein insertase
MPSAIIHEGPIAYLDGELYEPDYKDLNKGEEKLSLNAQTGWLGITEKYWFTAILPEQNKNARYKIDTGLSGEKSRYHVDYTGGGVEIAAGEAGQHNVHFFAGPKIVRMLEDYETAMNIPHFDLAVDFGIFYFMTRPFFTIVTWIGHQTGSFAMAILLFTVLLRIAVFPLANKSFRSFARMRKITPQMIELREKHGNDRAKLQQEIYALYQKENVNPMAGCLPILIQIPIFFSLYKVLFMSIEMRHAPFWGWIEDMSAMDPTSLVELFGLLPWDAPSFLHIGAWPCIMGITLLIQQKLNPPPQDPIQAKMLMFMPVMITFVLAKFPAGLVIYWSWSNILSMIQQVILMRSEGVDIHIFKKSKDEEKLEELIEHGPAGVSPAAEMIEEDVEDFIDGDFENEDEKARKAEAETTAKNPAAKKKSSGKKTTAKKKTGIKKPNTKNALKGK